MILLLLILRLLFSVSENVVDVMLVSIKAQIRTSRRRQLEVVRVIPETSARRHVKTLVVRTATHNVFIHNRVASELLNFQALFVVLEPQVVERLAVDLV